MVSPLSCNVIAAIQGGAYTFVLILLPCLPLLTLYLLLLVLSFDPPINPTYTFITKGRELPQNWAVIP